MIPRILHQTWKTDRIPEAYLAWGESWDRHNPGWTRMFWNDRMLVEFVAAYYPDFLKTFCGYRSGVMRADAARYLLLHHFGGVYADIDCECVASFEPILPEDRVVLCKEPSQHFDFNMQFRRLPYILFNGTMASPPGHPFWLHLLSRLELSRDAQEVIDATGPCILTSSQLTYPDQDGLVIHPSGLFTPQDRDGAADPDAGPLTLSVHHWAGTWWSPGRSRMKLRDVLRREAYRAKYLLTRGGQTSVAAARAEIPRQVIEAPAPSGGNIAMLVPLRDAAEHIVPFLEAIQQLDYPKERIKLVFCEGDSQDGSWDILCRAVEPLRAKFRDIVLLQKALGSDLDRDKRTRPKLQRERRTGIAKVRNHLIANGIDKSDDWALWVDIDVWRLPKDVIASLLGSGERIVVPNCVRVAGGGSFDLNSFVTAWPQKDRSYYKWVVNGLYQPPSTFPGRLYLSDLRHLKSVELHGVGGTMLLVDASLHRAGLLFPEKPYRDLVETEGFGVLARDLGITPIGLPQVEILHVPW